MIVATIDPTLGVIIVAVVTGIFLVINTQLLRLQRRDTKDIQRETRNNGGDSMRDAIDNVRDLSNAILNRQRLSERLQAKRHRQNRHRIEVIEDHLGIQPPPIGDMRDDRTRSSD